MRGDFAGAGKRRKEPAESEKQLPRVSGLYLFDALTNSSNVAPDICFTKDGLSWMKRRGGDGQMAKAGLGVLLRGQQPGRPFKRIKEGGIERRYVADRK